MRTIRTIQVIKRKELITFRDQLIRHLKKLEKYGADTVEIIEEVYKLMTDLSDKMED